MRRRRKHVLVMACFVFLWALINVSNKQDKTHLVLYDENINTAYIAQTDVKQPTLERMFDRDVQSFEKISTSDENTTERMNQDFKLERMNIQDKNNDIDMSSFDQHIHPKVFNNEFETDMSAWKLRYAKVNESESYRLKVFEKFRGSEKTVQINCKAILIENNENAIQKALQIMNSSEYNDTIQNQRNGFVVKSCSLFQKRRGYILHPLSQKELDLPLAFSILVYKDASQVERLLRAIYRPHNYYCIHVDKKSSNQLYRAINSIAKCFENVFVASDSVNVTWGTFSVLQAEIQCMKDLWHFKKWKYFINLTGQEYPLKTNREIVEILHSFDGANIVDGIAIR